MAPAMQFKVHPAEEKNSGLEDDEEVERARAVAAALGASLNVRLEKWHERTERHKQETVEGWILRQQGLITMLFTFLVFSPAWALFFNRVEGWAAWDSYVYVFTVITTIGYGNMYPSGPTGMYATILMGLTGIPLTCYALAWVGTASLRASHVILSNCRRRLGYAGKPTKMQEIYFSVFLFSAHFAHCVAVFCAMEAWTVTISCYYTFVTLSTVGLGDEIALYYKPQSRTWWRVLRAGAAEPYTDPDFRWEAGARPIRSATLEKIHWYHLWYLLAVFCGLAFVSQLFTLIVHWIHNLDDSFDREFSHIAGHMRLMGRRGRKAMACRHRDRSRDEQRAAKLLTKQRELLATQQQRVAGARAHSAAAAGRRLRRRRRGLVPRPQVHRRRRGRQDHARRIRDVGPVGPAGGPGGRAPRQHNVRPRGPRPERRPGRRGPRVAPGLGPGPPRRAAR